ncbi:DUF2065 domain-containing protein [Desulfonatronovibrio hydrogenovorans]|uniref:DUF2065 domain-containing protein n=1 Tax=Desulfonatronovibrio hydrogenovorans TaxID=53245 RepID=UPI0004907147|nr:DUF2065 domain-containing protein [Desulfonatronovibrio hydrogenovorans]
MQFDLAFFLCALGLAFILEGIPYFVWAEKMPRFLELLSKQPPSNLRRMGFTAIILGVLVIFLGRSLI